MMRVVDGYNFRIMYIMLSLIPLPETAEPNQVIDGPAPFKHNAPEQLGRLSKASALQRSQYHG